MRRTTTLCSRYIPVKDIKHNDTKCPQSLWKIRTELVLYIRSVKIPNKRKYLMMWVEKLAIIYDASGARPKRNGYDF